MKKLLIIPLFSLFILLGVSNPVKADDDYYKKVDFLQSQIQFEFISINNLTITVRVKNIEVPNIIEIDDFNADNIKGYSLNNHVIEYGVPNENSQRYQVIDYDYNSKVFTLEMSINKINFYNTINDRKDENVTPINDSTTIERLNTDMDLITLYNKYFDDFFNIYYKAEESIIRIEGRAPDNDYDNFGEPVINNAYAGRLSYSTGLGRVPVISNELFIGYNNFMIEALDFISFYDSNGDPIGNILINCGGSNCENRDGYGEKFDYMANSIDYAYNFAIYLNEYDINYNIVEFVEIGFLTVPFPTAQWQDHFKQDLYFSFNYEHSFLRINLYEQGYNEGFNDGEAYGEGKSNLEAYELGYRQGYDEALKNADVDKFLANFDKWIVPAIIVVMLLGGFFAVRRQKMEEL